MSTNFEIPAYIREPFLYDEVNQEPYIPLSYPHTNIRLTPPRLSDIEPSVAILNDRRVYAFLEGPPFPYTADDAKARITRSKQGCDDVFAQWQNTVQTEDGVKSTFGGCPVRVLRERKANGDDVFLGEFGMSRHGFPHVADAEEREKRKSENDNKLPGNPSIIWTIGDYLAPSHHGQGIMTAALRAWNPLIYPIGSYDKHSFCN
ncbi:hypothetical protein BOTBODRAFT_392390 [Botryobasidium botryosum FD-172 SS1]|uniref:N-acetyltransferase domain-containing protein n=1 Tax=Botryobasidium botryosum (strain FD-172 SS1) TaxID=930990 RepID=A0A067N824_BOTB1|nr:hypothetical protein BOTBODRAFT_392390 [Botryobasidium botryosum FD-172 SS1]